MASQFLDYVKQISPTATSESPRVAAARAQAEKSQSAAEKAGSFGSLFLKTITGLPGATLGLGKDIAAGMARVPLSAGEVIPRLVGGTKASTAIVPPKKIPGLGFLGAIQSYQSAENQRQQAGGSATGSFLRTAGNLAVDEPVGIAFKPLFFAGGLLLKTLGKKTIQESVEIIAKSKVADDIIKELDNVVKGSAADKRILADRLVNVEDPKMVNEMIQGSIKPKATVAPKVAPETQPLAKEARKYKSDEIVKYVDELDRGTENPDFVKPEDRGILSFTKKQIEGNESYTRQTVNIDDLIKKDPDLREYVEAGEQRYVGERDFFDIDAPIVVGKNGEIYDGMNRILTKKQNGETTIDAFVGSAENLPRAGERIGADIPTAKEVFEASAKERAFIKTVREAPITADEVAKAIEGSYNPKINQELVERATKLITENPEEALRIAKGPVFNDEVATIGQTLVVNMQKRGEYQTAIDLVEHIAAKATEAGRTVQALSIYERLSPEGVLRFAQRQMDNFNSMIADVTKRLKLTPDISEKLVQQAELIRKTKDPYERLVETAQLLKNIADLFPTSFARKVSFFQTLAQLLNFKTAIRNVVGNAGFMALENVTDVAAAILDTPLALITGKRSTSLPSLFKQASGFKKGFKEGVREAIRGINTKQLATQFEIPKTAVFKGPVGKALERTLSVVLMAPDRAFFEAAYQGSLYKQMKAAGVMAPTEIMKEVATFDGLYRTFQDDNVVSRLFVGLKRALNVGKDFGLGDLILKYPKTPGNLLKRGLDYSPWGFVQATFEASKPLMGKKFSQKAFVENFSRALVGTGGLIGTGAILHKIGIITGSRDKDSDVDSLSRTMGLGPYRLNASALKRFVLSGLDADTAKLQEGDNLVSYDWFQPAAIGISIGANINENKGLKAGGTLETVVNSIAGGVNTLAEQPLVQGVTNLFKFQDPADAFISAGIRAPSSFVPTLINQIRQLTDNTTPNTYDPGKIQTGINMVKARIPFLAKTLPARVNTLGQDDQTFKDSAIGTNNFFNVLFNPLFASKYKPSPEARMVFDLMNTTGETKQFPRVAAKSQTVNGVKIKMSANQMYHFQKFIGENTRAEFERLASDPAFVRLSDEKKIAKLSDYLTTVSAAGRIVILGNRPKKRDRQVMRIVNQYKTR